MSFVEFEGEQAIAFQEVLQRAEVAELRAAVAEAKVTSLESSLAEARKGARTVEAASNIAQEIIEIMTTYDEQDASGNVGTPGGLEHMGDVWGLLDRWRNELTRAQHPTAPQETAP